MPRYYLLAAEDLDPRRVAEAMLRARLPAAGCAFDSLEAAVWDLVLAHAAEGDPRPLVAGLAAAVGLQVVTPLLPPAAQPPAPPA